MVKKLGVIGFSEGNGHPFSFSAIFNGYNDQAIRNAGWGVIADYLAKCDSTDFGIPGFRVTHVWTQTPSLTQAIAESAYIENVCSDPSEMMGVVDGVIIARDDWESHAELAMPFLEVGKYVFVDKPMSLDPTELKAFSPFLKSSKLASCSGFRFARELDAVKSFARANEYLSFQGAILNDWDKYGIHLLDAMISVKDLRFKSVQAFDYGNNSTLFVLEHDRGAPVTIHTLGKCHKVLRCNFDLQGQSFTVNFEDNFSAFRRTLGHFTKMMNEECASDVFGPVEHVMATLIAGKQSVQSGSREKVSNYEF